MHHLPLWSVARSRVSPILIGLLAVCLLVLTGCQQLEGAAKIDKLRSDHTVTLTSFTVRDTIVDPEMVDMASEGESEGAEDGEAMVAEPEVRPDAYLDVLVGSNAAEALSRLTVDVYQADANLAEVQSWQHVLDTSSLEKGDSAQMTIIIEGVESFVDGHGFAVEIGSPAEADRGKYVEYGG